MVQWLAPGQPVDEDRAVEGHGGSHNIDGKDPTTDVKGGLRQLVSGGAIGVTLTDSTFVEVASIDIDTNGGLVEIEGFAAVSETKSGAAVWSYLCRIMRDGDFVNFGGPSSGFTGGAAAVNQSMPFRADETPPSGRHTYSIEVYYLAGSTTGTVGGSAYIKAKEYAL